MSPDHSSNSLLSLLWVLRSRSRGSGPPLFLRRFCLQIAPSKSLLKKIPLDPSVFKFLDLPLVLAMFLSHGNQTNKHYYKQINVMYICMYIRMYDDKAIDKNCQFKLLYTPIQARSLTGRTETALTRVSK